MKKIGYAAFLLVAMVMFLATSCSSKCAKNCCETEACKEACIKEDCCKKDATCDLTAHAACKHKCCDKAKETCHVDETSAKSCCKTH